LAVLAAVAVLGSSLAACGETGRSDASGSSSASSGGDVTIGLIVPTDTPSTNQPGAVGGAKAAVAAVNAEGGINGHKVGVLYCNDKGDPNESTKCARQMVSKKVVAVIGGSALNDKLIAPILGKSGIPMVGWDAYFTYGAPNAYLYSGGSFFSNQWSTAYAIHAGLKLSLVWSDNATGAGLRTILEGVAKQAGGKFVNEVAVPPTASDFGAYVAAAQKNGANAVMVFLGLQQGAQFIQGAEAAKAPFQAYFKSSVDPSLMKEIGSATDRLYSASSFPPASSDKLAGFRKEMSAENDRGDEFADPDHENESAISTWLAVHTITKLLAKSDVSAAALVKVLDSAKDIDMGGIIPPWTPTAPGPSDAFSRVSNSSLYRVSFKGGTGKLETQAPIPLEDMISGKTQ
jgi:ABC-type branched-subunit amino acid transport system substrate-binding protein